MNEMVRDRLQTAVTDVMETFAFVFVDLDEPPGVQAPNGDIMLAEMSFFGPGAGSLCMAAPMALCREMAANALGIEMDEIADVGAEDALKELLNITCGKLTFLMYGPKAIVELTVPEIGIINRPRWQKLRDDPGTIPLFAEDTVILTNCQIKKEASPWANL